MPSKLNTTQLLLITKSEAKVIKNFRLGVYLTSISGGTIDDIIDVVSVDRFKFANRHLAVARASVAGAKPNYRNALARAYYSMYHAARSVVFHVEKGDDHQEHSELPKHLPGDFPDRARWENALKNARLERNRADYDPYPKSDKAFKTSAEQITKDAKEFVALARIYLKKKGCKL